MVEMKVVGLSLDEATKAPILVLKRESSEEVLPIWIGAMEAMAISLALNNVDVPRPLTHDLLLSTLEVLRAELVGVDLVDLREGTYFAELVIIAGGRQARVDCRPSDAIALALRASVPILVREEVLQRAAEDKMRPMQGGETAHKPVADSTLVMVRKSGTEPDEQQLSDLLKSLDPETKYRM